MAMDEAAYRSAICSKHWRELRARVLSERGAACEGCGESGCRLELHHETYARLGRELDSDVRLLCVDCHRAEDILRAERGEEKLRLAERFALERSVDGFMRRRFGSCWEDRWDWDEALEMFYERVHGERSEWFR